MLHFHLSLLLAHTSPTLSASPVLHISYILFLLTSSCPCVRLQRWCRRHYTAREHRPHRFTPPPPTRAQVQVSQPCQVSPPVPVPSGDIHLQLCAEPCFGVGRSQWQERRASAVCVGQVPYMHISSFQTTYFFLCNVFTSLFQCLTQRCQGKLFAKFSERQADW